MAVIIWSIIILVLLLGLYFQNNRSVINWSEIMNTGTRPTGENNKSVTQRDEPMAAALNSLSNCDGYVEIKAPESVSLFFGGVMLLAVCGSVAWGYQIGDGEGVIIFVASMIWELICIFALRDVTYRFLEVLFLQKIYLKKKLSPKKTEGDQGQ